MPNGISKGNAQLLEWLDWRRETLRQKPELFHPWRRPCVVRTLLVADGNLNFGPGDFGLSTFVHALIGGRSYASFELTLAHRRAYPTDTEMMVGEPGITRSIRDFRFDNNNHFKSDAFNEVWLFGIESAASQAISQAEVDAIADHMSARGGVFATGDHSFLGKALCGAIPRVRNMRYWDDFAGGEASMIGSRRNDSNQSGHDPGSQFSDQSDDIPQPLELKLYTSFASLFREARYPHPVMCSRYGRIDVFPDHPHEGEVRLPDSLSAVYLGTDEYPMALDGSGRVSPEIVATGRVPAGNNAVINNSPTKAATSAHTFGVVSTYDGHLADVGRIVCDSTWHHFVNVNLVGVVEGDLFDDFPRYVMGTLVGGTPGTHASKHDGFASSAAGLAVLDKIREYYLNIGVWIAPPDRHQCFSTRFWFDILWEGRVVEATLSQVGNPASEVSLPNLFHIGIHARDVIGRKAGACQSLHWTFPLIEELEEFRRFIDPWAPWPERRDEMDAPLPWLDVEPLLNVALGSAVVELYNEFQSVVEDIDEIAVAAEEIARRGAREGLQRGLTALQRELRSVTRSTNSGLKTFDKS
jgi:hypothetical protein